VKLEKFAEDDVFDKSHNTHNYVFLQF